MVKPQAYIDTNVVLDFLWDEWFSQEATKTNTPYRVFENAAKGNFEAYISYYTIIEVALHFNDYYLLQKGIQKGYSFHQFKSFKKEFKLTQGEIDDINEITETLKNWQGVNFVEIDKVEGKFFKDELMKYVSHSVELMDALHISTAIDLKCTNFITKDTELRQRIENMKRDHLIPTTLRPVKPGFFLREISD